MPHVNHNGTKLYWTAEGSGDPLLLIMGLGYTSDMWHRTVPEMAKHFRTIRFDNRGVGKSDVPPGPYSIAGMAADAAAVLDAAGVSAAHVLGMSMGGMIAQEFALQYPGRTRKLVLGCTACGGPKAVRAERVVNDTLMNRATMTQEEAAVAMLAYIYDEGTPRERIEEDLAIRRPVLPTPAGYLAQLQGVIAWQSYERLGQITSDTLVIHGETDRLIPIGNGQLIADSIPGAKLVRIPNASHIFMTDQPEASNAAILEFLK